MYTRQEGTRLIGQPATCRNWLMSPLLECFVEARIVPVSSTWRAYSGTTPATEYKQVHYLVDRLCNCIGILQIKPLTFTENVCLVVLARLHDGMKEDLNLGSAQ